MNLNLEVRQEVLIVLLQDWDSPRRDSIFLLEHKHPLTALGELLLSSVPLQ